MPTARCVLSRSRFWRTRQHLCQVSPGDTWATAPLRSRGPRPSSHGDGRCRRAVRPVGAHAGTCTGPEDIAGGVALRKATDGLFIEARKGGARKRALHRKRYIVATQVRRPPVASSLERGNGERTMALHRRRYIVATHNLATTR